MPAVAASGAQTRCRRKVPPSAAYWTQRHSLRRATHSSAPSRRSAYACSPTGLSRHVPSTSGVAKPPSAANTMSVRVRYRDESHSATAVVADIAANASGVPMKP